MPARDFINETLLPWLEREIADEVSTGSQHYLRGFEDALRMMNRFIEEHRPEWDEPENLSG